MSKGPLPPHVRAQKVGSEVPSSTGAKETIRSGLVRRRRIVVVGTALAMIAAVTLAWLVMQDDNDAPATAQSQMIAKLDTPDVHSLLVDPADPDHLLFGSHAGIMESRDGGFTWVASTFQNKDAMSIAVSPQDPDTLYVTGHDVAEVSYDGGASWQRLNHDLPGTDIHAFAQDIDNSSLLYAYIAGFGVFRSENGGTNWAPLAVQPPGGSPRALVSGGGRLLAATEAGITVSGDQGASWKALAIQPGETTLTLAASPRDPNLLYAGTPEGLARSQDGGLTWNVVGPPGVTPLTVVVAPSDPLRIIFVAQGGGVYRSDNSGATWLTRP